MVELQEILHIGHFQHSKDEEEFENTQFQIEHSLLYQLQFCDNQFL